MNNILDILDNDKEVLAHIGELDSLFFDITKRHVCRTCAADIRFMIFTLKQANKMLEFEFKKARAQYKIRREDKYTISNSTLTNEKALDFLKQNPKRIALFSKYPKDWKKQMNKSKEDVEKELAIKAELAEAKRADKAEAEKTAKAKKK